MNRKNKKRKSFFDYKPIDLGPGSERSSQEIDEVRYGPAESP